MTISTLVAALIMAVLPIATTYLWEGFQKWIAVLDGLPKWAKQLVTVLIPIGLNFLANAIHVDTIPGDIHNWTETTLLSILQGVVAIGIHTKQKEKALGTPQ